MVPIFFINNYYSQLYISTLPYCKQQLNHSVLFFTDYVLNIYDTLTTNPKKELKSLAEELKEEVPAPLHTMLVEKESKEEAITKCRQRKEKDTVMCPSSCTGIIIK